MDIIIRFSDKGAQVIVPKDCNALQIVFAAALLTREMNKGLDMVEFQQSQMQGAIQKVRTLPTNLMKNDG